MSKIPNSGKQSKPSKVEKQQQVYTWLDGFDLGKRDCRSLLINVHEDVKKTAEKRRTEFLSGDYVSPEEKGYLEFRRGYVQGFKTVMSACRTEERDLEKSKRWVSLPKEQTEDDEFMEANGFYGGLW